MFQDISSKKKFFKIFQTDRKILTCHLVCCNFSKSQGGKIQILLELSYHSHLKKEGMTAAIVDHRRRGGRSKPYRQVQIPITPHTMSTCQCTGIGSPPGVLTSNDSFRLLPVQYWVGLLQVYSLTTLDALSGSCQLVFGRTSPGILANDS